MARWLEPAPVVLPEGLVEAAGSRELAEVLFRRGYTTPEAAAAFLTGGVDLDVPELPDLDQAVAVLTEAITAGRSVCVYGDYDTDGITATTLLVDLLRRLGAQVTYYIPNRFRDGYGLNPGAVEVLAREGVEVLLTCDCGIRNLEEVALARSLGMQVVVTDHHELGPQLPDAEAVVNPKRLPEGHPCRMLPGVGTAYLLSRQLLRALGRPPEEADRWLDLVAVGIIADVVPLIGANRVLARRGLMRLNTSPSAGLAALMTAAGLEGPVTEEDVAFQLAPRLNSAGRLADGSLGVRLLLAAGGQEAADLAVQLDHLNTERKRLTAKVVEEAEAAVTPEAPGILLYRPHWHEGILGIAAGRLAEQYGVPALLIARKQAAGLLVGSARAPAGFGLHEALEACGEHLVKYGGHDAAAGFSLREDQFEAFRAAMLEEIRRRTRDPHADPARPADLVLPMAQVNRRLYEDLRRGAPYGEGNPAPVIFSRRVKLLSARPAGPREEHLRLVFRDGETALVGIWWRAGGKAPSPGEVDLFYRLELHCWNGEELLQAVVEAICPAEVPEEDGLPVTGPLAAAAVVAERAAEAKGPLVLVDRRGEPAAVLAAGHPRALLVAEGPGRPAGIPVVDRYGMQPAEELVLLTPPPGPKLLDEAIARAGARRVILGWPREPWPEEERFLPMLLKATAEALQQGPWVSLSRLAVRTGELESTVRLGLLALAESKLLVIEDEEGDRMRLHPCREGKGIKKGPALERMRSLLQESRAFRRFLRTASAEAIRRSIYIG